jgi:hypothetical protein
LTQPETKGLKYRFCSNGTDYEINAVLEGDLATMAKDGGDQFGLYEIGTNLNLCSANW